MDPEGPRYVLPQAFEAESCLDQAPMGLVGKTTLDSLGLTLDQSFGYWFDFEDDWWHRIDVVAIEELTPGGKYTRLIKSVGKSPPQYPDEDE